MKPSKVTTSGHSAVARVFVPERLSPLADLMHTSSFRFRHSKNTSEHNFLQSDTHRGTAYGFCVTISHSLAWADYIFQIVKGKCHQDVCQHDKSEPDTQFLKESKASVHAAMEYASPLWSWAPAMYLLLFTVPLKKLSTRKLNIGT